MTWSLWGSHQGMSMSIMEEKPWYCQTHQSGVDIPALVLPCEPAKMLEKTARWTFIFPVPCPMAGSILFKPFLTHLSFKPPALVIPPFPPSQQLIPALLYPHSSKSPLLAFKLLITCPIHRETCVPPLLAEAFYIIAGCYPISLQSLD